MNKWMTAKSQSHQAHSSIPFPWLTLEYTLWGFLLVIALGLRVFRLGAAPLNTSEAYNALFAWRFAHGGGAPADVGYSPALFSSQWLTFLIFSASEITARLWPALAGTALVLAPALLRTQLGRLGALVTGLLLALSPTALTLSRTASGDVLAALGALLCAAGISHFLTRHLSRLQPAIYLIPLGLAMMLASSPLAYSALLVLGLALLLVAFVDFRSREQIHRGWTALRSSPNLMRHLLVTFAVSAMLLSTAFAWHLGGLGAFADLLPQWLRGFIRWPDSLSPAYPGFILIIYEPLILLTGMVGLALATLRGNPTSLFLALWSIVALLLSLVRPGHGPGDVLLTLVPLACLGGQALGTLLENVRRWGHWLAEGLYLLISAPLWAYLVINLSTYSSQSGQYTHVDLVIINVLLPTFLILALATLVMLLILVAAVGYFRGVEPALRGLGLSTTLALLLFTIATAWGVSQNRPADPRELLVLEPTAPQVRLLKESLSRFSSERRGHAHAIDVTLLADDPALTWALREFHEARITEVTENPIFTSAAIAPQTLGKPSLGVDYLGQSFPLRRRWGATSLGCRWTPVQIGTDQLNQLDCSAMVKWLVYRQSPERPAEERVVLWLRRDLTSR